MPHLLSTYDLQQLCGESHTLIRVLNLSLTLPLATDAWGRPSQQQPVLISCTVSLRAPFSSSSSTDAVNSSTVHYGILSKSILLACDEFKELCHDDTMPVPMHLRALLQYVHFYLTHTDTFPAMICPPPRGSWKESQSEPVLAISALRMLELEVVLPKASLLGEGVSLKGCFAYGTGNEKLESGPSAYSMCLGIRKLRVACLVGLNDCERKARQTVVCGVEMERWDRMVDTYCEIEELVVKTIEESSFQTLEALVSHLGTRIIKYFLIPYLEANRHSEHPKHSNFQKIRIRLEKPTAVTFADAPVVEVLIDSNPEQSKLAKDLWDHPGPEKAPPFPLQGRLDEWIAKTGAF